MSAEAQRITALAAELSEADIGEIIRAKVPANIRGREVSCVSITWADYGDGLGVLVHSSLHVGQLCAVCMPTFASAAEEVAAKLATPAEAARDLRAQAAKLIAEAAKIENQEGAKS